MDKRIVTLKDGTEQVARDVAVHMYSLRRILAEHPVAFNALVMKARDRQYEWESETVLGYLKRLNAVKPDGSLYCITEQIVRCAVYGAGFGMRLLSPLLSSEDVGDEACRDD